MVDTSLEHKLKILNAVLKDLISKQCIIFFCHILDECKEKIKLQEYQHVHALRIFQDYLKTEAPVFCCKKELLEKYIASIKDSEKFHDILHVYIYIYYKFYAEKYISNAKTISKDHNFIDLFLREIFVECARKLFVTPHAMENSTHLNLLLHESIDLTIKKKLVLNILIKKEQRESQTTILPTQQQTKKNLDLNKKLLSKSKISTENNSDINDFILKK